MIRAKSPSPGNRSANAWHELLAFDCSSAEKVLLSLPRALQARARARIDALAVDPRPPGCVKITGSTHSYRIRIGDYRIIYEIHDDRRVVIVYIVGHRRDVYRGI